VSREDCAAAAAAVLTTDGHEDRVYEITGPELVSQADLAALVTEITGRAIEVVEIDDETAARALADVGLPPELARAYSSFGTAIREGLLRTVSTAVHDLTGREPRPVRKVLEAHRSEIEETP
jgi:NAD(P)H dehydrogenase (quinone)